MFHRKVSCGRVLLRREQKGSPAKELDKSLACVFIKIPHAWVECPWSVGFSVEVVWTKWGQFWEKGGLVLDIKWMWFWVSVETIVHSCLRQPLDLATTKLWIIFVDCISDSTP